MSQDCGDELYFMTQIYFYSETDWNSDSLVAFISSDASDECWDGICLTMDQTGFPCPSSQGATGKILKNKAETKDAMPSMCKWQMFLSSQLCVADDMAQDTDTLLTCMEESFSDDCHDVICGVMDDTGESCPENPVGNIDIFDSDRSS